MTSIAAWGPTLVMALAALLVGTISLAAIVRTRHSRSRYEPLIQDRGLAALSSAIHDAELINVYNPGLPSDPTVHLKPIARIKPAKYQDAVHQIPECFSQRCVVSLDLTSLSDRQAARLVDFCSGYLIGSSGWLLRATDKVMLLIPNDRKVDDAS